MAESLPNLDDEKLWLPSDFFSIDDGTSKFSSHPNNNYSDLMNVEYLAQRFASLALLQHNRTQTFSEPPQNLSPNLQRFRPDVRYASLPGGYFGYTDGLGVSRNGGAYDSSGPACYQFLNPVQPGVERLMEIRARVLQKQRERFLQKQVMENRLFAFQGSGFGVGGNGGGYVRDYGGTGVFLPRISSNGSTSTSNNATKRQSVRNRQHTQIFPPRNFIERVEVRNQEKCHCQLPPEMGLPQDWTY